jgi:hypothetical protein
VAICSCFIVKPLRNLLAARVGRSCGAGEAAQHRVLI